MYSNALIDINVHATDKEPIMNRNTVALLLPAIAVLASFAVAPAIAQEAEHDHQHQASTAKSPEKATKKTPGKPATEARKAVSGGGMMDMKTMCDMHRQMMASGSEADREAMADKEFKGMSAEQKRQHMKMMDEQCK